LGQHVLTVRGAGITQALAIVTGLGALLEGGRVVIVRGGLVAERPAHGEHKKSCHAERTNR
jgi:hypothetical protein